MRQRLTLAALLGGALLLTLLPPFARGAIGIARNDDWDFSRSLFSSVEAGHMVVDPWTSAMLWGHLVWAWPLVETLGENRAALQVATALLGLIGLLVLHGLLREWAAPWVATTTVALTALGPLYPPLAGSYMTDVPAFVLQMLALSAGARALSGPRVRWAWWCAALALALAGFTLREYSVAVLAGLAAGLLLRRPGRRELGWAAAGLGLWVALATTLFWLRFSSTPPIWAAGVETERSRVALSLVVSGRGLATLSLLVAPALPWLVAHLVSTARTRRAAAAVTAGLAVTAVIATALAVVFRSRGEDALPLLPGYLSNTPAYSNTLAGAAPAWMPSEVWFLVGIGSLATAECVALLVVTTGVGRLRGRTPHVEPHRETREARVTRAICLGFLVGGVALVTGVNALRGFPALDRYFLPLAPFLLAGVLSLPIRGVGVRLMATGTVAALTMAWSAWGLAATDAAATNDALRWSVGRELSEQGWSPSTIDAGYEWWGAHQSVPTTAGSPRPGTRFWPSLFPRSPICVQVSYASRRGAPGDVLLTRSARTLTGTEIALVARTFDPTCSRPIPPAGS